MLDPFGGRSHTARMYLDPESLSPDPTVGRATERLGDGWRGMVVYPHALPVVTDPQPAIVRWADTLHLHRAPGPLRFEVPRGDTCEWVIDFGTILEGALEIELETTDTGHLSISFGESLWEAREWGPASACVDQRPTKQYWKIDRRGKQRRRFEEGGFRFVRLRWLEFVQPLQLHALQVHARFRGELHRGTFRCGDAPFQRIWHSAAYTARLCTRADGFWDGIKRDRLGWFGDARITQQAWNRVFAEPEPALSMLAHLPVDRWANGIPNYSFDALTMLREHLLIFGASAPQLGDIVLRIRQFLDWVVSSQLDADGLITRTPATAYFFDIGFCDWSPQPLGGKLEALGWLQCAWLEAVQTAVACFDLLGASAEAARWRERAATLAATLHPRFRCPGYGFHHTLAQGLPPGSPWTQPTEPGLHYRCSYVEGKNYGPSGPSLHSAARAVWAGLCGPVEAAELKTQVWTHPRLPAPITGYYQYYVQHARAALGERVEALHALRGYYMCMLEPNDAPCVWESFEPEARGIEKWGLGPWPKSLCHGWSTGPVPLTERFLFGLEPTGLAWSQVRLLPAIQLPWSFQASIPTPQGIIQLDRATGNAPIRIRLPEAIAIDGPVPAGVQLERLS